MPKPKRSQLSMDIASHILEVIDDLDGLGLIVTDDELLSDALHAHWGEFSTLKKLIINGTPEARWVQHAEAN